MTTINISDVGPIERLEIPLPAGGGLCVLRGPNGSGKSHALVAAQALGSKDVRVVSRDGSLGAQIEGLGVRLTAGRRATRSGELEFSLLEGEDPSLLVDPGIKDAAAADAARLRALLRLSRAKVDASAFAALVGGDERLRELCRSSSLDERDVPTMAASIKRDLEAAARKLESQAENLTGKAQGIQATLHEFEGGGPIRVACASAAEARASHTEAVRAQSALAATREQNARLLRGAAEARAALEQLGDAGTSDEVECTEAFERARAELLALGEAGKPRAVELARGAVETKRALLENLRREVARAERELEVATAEAARQEQAVTQRAELEADVAALDRERRAAAQRAALGRALDAAKDAREISDDELAKAAARVERAEAEVEAWAIRDRTAGLRAEMERILAQGQAAAREGAELRDAGRGTERVVLDAVRTVCGEGMEIQDGRLYVHTDRGRELFSELSHGERWRKALDVAVAAVGHRGLLVVRQEAYEALDPTNKREINSYARELGVVILTAASDEGELRAEVAE